MFLSLSVIKNSVQIKTAHLHLIQSSSSPSKPRKIMAPRTQRNEQCCVFFPLCCSSCSWVLLSRFRGRKKGWGGRRRLSTVEGQCWGGGVFNLGLVQSDPCEAGGFYVESLRGACFGEMLNSTCVSSHRRTHSQWRWQSPPSTWVMVPSLLWMQALLTCHSSWLPSFHAPVGGTAAKTVDFLYTLQGQGELGCGFL